MSKIKLYKPYFDAKQAFEEAMFIIQNEFITSRAMLRAFLPWNAKDFNIYLGDEGIISKAIDYQITIASDYRKSMLIKKWALSGDFNQEKQAFKMLGTDDELRRFAGSFVPSLTIKDDGLDDIEIEWVDDED